MRAAILREAGQDLSIEEVGLAEPQAHEVLVRIAATGVCHSDLSVIRGKVKVDLPLVPGHEASGVVERVGPGVSKVKPGDRVILSWAPNCGHCFYCDLAHPTLCTVYGEAAGAGTLWDGTSRLGLQGEVHHYSCVSSFSEYVVVPEAGCLPLPDHVSFEVGALVGCAVTTGFGAVVNDAAAGAGDSVAVLGIGGVGVNALQAARIVGAEMVIAIDIDPAKEATARTFGATHFVDARALGAADEVRALTGGRGVDHAIECSGHPAAMRLAYDATRPAGSIVVVGIASQGVDFAFPATGFPGSKKRIIGSIYGGGVPEDDIARIFALYGSGKLALDEQIGARIGLDQVNEALRAMEAGVSGRTIILPGSESLPNAVQ